MKRVAKVVEHTQGTLDPFVFNVVGLRGVRGFAVTSVPEARKTKYYRK